MSSYFEQWNSSIVRPDQQRFGVAFDSGDFVSPLIIPLNAVYLGKGIVPNYSRSSRSQSARSDKGSHVATNNNKYEINLDVQQFEPNEITVKVNGNNVTIEGNHDEKHDRHGSVSRQFVRKYWVPNGHNLNKIVSNLSSDGILTVSVPRADEANEERIVPILQNRSAADVQRKENDNDDINKEKREKKSQEKHDEKLGEKQEEQEDKRDEQKEEDEKND